MTQTCLLIWGWPGSLYSLHDAPTCLLIWRWPGSLYTLHDDRTCLLIWGWHKVFTHFMVTQTCLLIWGWPGSLYSLHDDPNMFTHSRMTWKSSLTSGWPGSVYSLQADLEVFTHFMMTWKCLLTSWWPGSVPLPLQFLGQTGGWWRRGECCTAHCPEKEHTVTVHSIRFTLTHPSPPTPNVCWNSLDIQCLESERTGRSVNLQTSWEDSGEKKLEMEGLVFSCWRAGEQCVCCKMCPFAISGCVKCVINKVMEKGKEKKSENCVILVRPSVTRLWQPNKQAANRTACCLVGTGPACLTPHSSHAISVRRARC